MISDFLQVAAAVTLGILSLFGIIELIGWIDAGITAILMSLYARKIGWRFQPGICSLFVTKPFKLTCPDNGGFTISVNRNVKMKYSHSSIRVEMPVKNDIRGSLLVRPRGFFQKKHRYFNNQWDKKLLVQSRPASFGRKIFSSPETLSTIHKLIKGKFPHSYNHIQITPSGKFGILLIDKGFNAQRADALIWLAKEVASQLKQIKD